MKVVTVVGHQGETRVKSPPNWTGAIFPKLTGRSFGDQQVVVFSPRYPDVGHHGDTTALHHAQHCLDCWNPWEQAPLLR